MSRQDMLDRLEDVGVATRMREESGNVKVVAELVRGIMPAAPPCAEVHYHFHGNITVVTSGNSSDVFVGDAPARVAAENKTRRY